MRTDHSDEQAVADLMATVRQASDRIDILVNDIWGGDELTEWQPFWTLDTGKGFALLDRAVRTHIITSRLVAPVLVAQKSGLIVEVTDGDHAGYRGSLFYDLAKSVYRVRELAREPLPLSKLRFQNERENRADQFVNARLVKVMQRDHKDDFSFIRGAVRDDARLYTPTIVIDQDQRMVNAECNCYFYGHHKLHKGPCEHMLALRRQSNQEQAH